MMVTLRGSKSQFIPLRKVRQGGSRIVVDG